MRSAASPQPTPSGENDAVVSLTDNETSTTRAAAPTLVSTERYDFTDITPRALLDHVNRLIDRSEITLDEATPLVGIGTGAAAPGPTADGMMDITPNRRINAFEHAMRGISIAEARHDADAAHLWQQAAAAMGRFQGRAVER